MSSTARPHRGTIFAETAEVLAHTAWPDGQFVLRLAASACAAAAAPGQFAHVQCAAHVPMRRPLSLLRANPAEGWIEVLYKTHGAGLAALATARPGDTVNVLGPIGRGFQPAVARPRAVLLGGGVGIPPLVFLAERLAGATPLPIGFFGSELPFPFSVVPARTALTGVPAAATGSLAELDARGLPVRLASRSGLPGCHAGFVTDLAREWLRSQSPATLDTLTIYACGPTPMLKASQQLAREFAIPTQLCLEEFMACAVGGCAGCVVPVMVDGKRAMKRVCVDGPVFDGATVYPDAA